MKRIMLDTNAYAALLRSADTGVLDAVDFASEVLMSVIVLGELYAGFRGGTKYARNVADLNSFLDDQIVSVVAVTEGAAEVFGEVKHALKRAGTPLPTNDVMYGLLPSA